jgi:CHASE2 domain-containing sensor protein
MVAARAGESAAGDARVTIVSIDDADILRWGWPLSDELLARAIGRLQEGAPAAIGIDLYRDVAVPPGGEDLAAALGAANLIGVAKLPSAGRTPIPGPPALEASGRVGFTDFPLDPGGVVRRALLYADTEGETQPSFGLLLALGYLARQQIGPQPGERDPGHLRLGRATLAPFEATTAGTRTRMRPASSSSSTSGAARDPFRRWVSPRCSRGGSPGSGSRGASSCSASPPRA